MLALITAAIIASTNTPLSALREMPGRGSRRAEVSGSEIVERKRYFRVQSGKTNEVWRTSREFPLMFVSPRMKKANKGSKQ